MKPYIKSALSAIAIILSLNSFASPDGNSVKLYPNPSNDVLKIDFSSQQDLNHIRVFNSIGQMVLDVDANQAISNVISINTSNWNAGTYYMQLQTPLGIDSKSFMVKH